MIAKVIGGSTLAAAGLGTAYSVYSDEGTRRSLKFWYNIAPIYAQYRVVQFLNRDTKIISDTFADHLYTSCNEKYTDRVRDITYEMRGFYLKQAQLLSTRHDFVPKEYMKWIKDTQDNVPSELGPGEAKTYVAKLLKEELNLDFDDVFDEWEETALGIASIGEVHKCRLKKTGQVVALKFQFPGMEQRFRADIRTLKAFCELAMPQHVSGFKEIEKQFTTEFDYRKEAENLNLVRANVLPRWGHFVVIPEANPELCSKHLLTMEYLHGVTLVDGIRTQYKLFAESLGLTIEEIEEKQKLAVQSGAYQFSSLEEAKRRNFLLRLWAFIKDLFLSYNPLRFVWNVSPLRVVIGPAHYKWTQLPVDLAEVLEILARVHASEIFADGVFNGDCHPGNVLLLKDGRLGLIDYGQVKHLAVEERIKYAKLILAIARDDKSEICRVFYDEMGTKTKYMKSEIGYKMACFYNDRDTVDLCGDKNIAYFIDYLEAEDPMVQLPEAYIMAARVSIMLRGMGNAFGLKLRTSKLWEDEARQFLASQGIKA